MDKILALVEGQTEERFVKDVLSPYLYSKNKLIIPKIINTKVVKSGPNCKGGWVSYVNAKKDLLRLLGDTSASLVTTLVDYYGLPQDFPTWNCTGNCFDKVEAAEKAFSEDIQNSKFLPYIQLHEFEGLLFSSPRVIADTLVNIDTRSVQNIRNSVSSPEEINQGAETHPSKRLLRLFPQYNKPHYGTLISSRIGIEEIIDNCPHFKSWIEKLIN